MNVPDQRQYRYQGLSAGKPVLKKVSLVRRTALVNSWSCPSPTHMGATLLSIPAPFIPVCEARTSRKLEGFSRHGPQLQSLVCPSDRVRCGRNPTMSQRSGRHYRRPNCSRSSAALQSCSLRGRHWPGRNSGRGSLNPTALQQQSG
jgi:hypothetical protein